MTLNTETITKVLLATVTDVNILRIHIAGYKKCC